MSRKAGAKFEKKNSRVRKKKIMIRRRFCRFCADENLEINYKDIKTLKHFITERGKIIPKRITGTCAKHQRKIAREIKKARVIAILPYVGNIQ